MASPSYSQRGASTKGRRYQQRASVSSTSSKVVPVHPIIFENLRDEGEHFMHVALWMKAIESFTKVGPLKIMLL